MISHPKWYHHYFLSYMYLNINEKGIMRINLCSIHRKPGLHYNDVIMGAMASQIASLAIVYFTQAFIQVQIKENIKAPRHWPLWGEFTGTGEFPAQRASNAENVSIWWRHENLIKVSDIKEVTNQELIRTEIVYQRSQGHWWRWRRIFIHGSDENQFSRDIWIHCVVYVTMIWICVLDV